MGYPEGSPYWQARVKNSSGCYEEDAMKTLVDIYGSYAAGTLNTKGFPMGYLYPAIRPMQQMLDKKVENIV